MEIEKVNIEELISPEYNPREITPEEMEKLKTSIQEFGYVDPIIVNKVNNHIVGGNQRYEALKQLGYKEVDVILIHEPNIDREKMINIRLNNSSGKWDTNQLQNILNDLELKELDISLTGFDIKNLKMEEINKIPTNETITADLNNGLTEEKPNPLGKIIDTYSGENNTGEAGSLKRDYIQPPFSILKANSKDWLDMKKELNDNINDNIESRENLISDEFGTSLFDPVLATLMIKWFAPKGKSNIIDCFSGDSTIGAIADMLGHKFTGIELRQEQVDLNNSRLKSGQSRYICDDGQNVLNHVAEKSQDLLFSCPPYYDLEVYSDLPNDASNQGTYDDFMKILENAFTDTAKTLKDDRFAVIVTANIRDKQGFYYPIVSDINKIFMKAGMRLYNDMVIADPLGSAGLRARRQFRNRKVVKVHQNILIFYKGDVNKIRENYQLECEIE